MAETDATDASVPATNRAIRLTLKRYMQGVPSELHFMGLVGTKAMRSSQSCIVLKSPKTRLQNVFI